MSPEALRLPEDLSELASRGVFLGCSSWKYPGWLGSIYDEQNYLTRGKFSEAKFNRSCLNAYAETFPAVCVDAGYYQFPAEGALETMASQVPGSFKFAFKVTEHITVKRYPALPRYGKMAGQENPVFLSGRLFQDRFLGPVQALGEKLGVIIFEFSTFRAGDFAQGREFLQRLDAFFDEIPSGFQYAVELRNRSLLRPETTRVLQKHQVALCLTSWTRMPAFQEQLSREDCFTADFSCGRLLLKPGRRYQEAVDAFAPYAETVEVNPGIRQAGAKWIQLTPKARPSFLFANNRLEGNSPATLAGIVSCLRAGEGPQFE